MGAIYTWAAGNGADENDDDCNADGYANSPYNIAVGALNQNGGPASYSESCSAVMVATYGGDIDENLIVCIVDNMPVLFCHVCE